MTDSTNIELSDQEFASHLAGINHTFSSGTEHDIIIEHGFDWAGFKGALKRLSKAKVGFSDVAFQPEMDLSDPDDVERVKPILDDLQSHLQTLQRLAPTALRAPDQVNHRIYATVPNATMYLYGLGKRDPEKVFIVTMSDTPCEQDELRSLSKLVNLRSLEMFAADIGYADLHVIDFGALQNLQFLDLSYNDFESLPQEIEELSSLESLNLRGCRSLWELEPDFTKLSHLRLLNLEKTDVDTDTIEELREEMPDCTILG